MPKSINYHADWRLPTLVYVMPCMSLVTMESVIKQAANRGAPNGASLSQRAA